jgi:hypothetical protein
MISFRRLCQFSRRVFLNKLLVTIPLCACASLLISGAANSISPLAAAWCPDDIFPSLYFISRYNEWLAGEEARPYWVRSEGENSLHESWLKNWALFINDDIIALYGHPDSPNMGIVGRYSKEELNFFLDDLAAEYNAVNGSRGVRKALYLIYGTVQPRGRIGYLDETRLLEYLDFSLKHDILLFIDHQIGRYDPVNSLEKMLPYLYYPNVHLALDPEWRTARPMMEIGSVSAGEINRAQEAMSRYLVERGIPGRRMLVIHQFDWRMIRNRNEVQTGYEGVNLVHCADGFGSPELKRNTYAYNAQANNMPIKGFKLFFNFGIPGAGHDEPLLSPEEVNTLVPRPSVIIYQ